ncbi:MAG: isoaspartyl peptidase/L-asparaginase [Chloroflexi bacterium]|nr:isoaspartyl peptidase/L-asparaginase [Chloroflexota bacterium]
MEPVIVVHGGAGNDFDDRVAEFRVGVERATQTGWAVLSQGGSALNAVEAAVRMLEDDPNFDAGHGSFLNANNEVEMDAMVMEGAKLGYGAVAGIQRVSHPVSVARLVMEHTPHSIFVGAGAEQFARSMGVPDCPMWKNWWRAAVPTYCDRKIAFFAPTPVTRSALSQWMPAERWPWQSQPAAWPEKCPAGSATAQSSAAAGMLIMN